MKTEQYKEIMKSTVGVFVKYAKQPSTWKGISLLCLAGGWYVDPTMIEQFGMGVAAAIGLIDTLWDEDKK